MKLLLMGVGYVGLALAKALQGKAYEISIATTSPEKVQDFCLLASCVYLLDSASHQSLKHALDQVEAIVVMVAPAPQSSYEETYLKTALHIEACLKDRVKPLHIIYLSSTSVYEGHDTEWVDETLKISPLSSHTQVLAEAEKIYLKHPSTCIFRLSGIYGPERTLEKRALNFSGRLVKGTGNEVTNHIHLDDIVRAILFALERHLIGVYNLTSDAHPTRDELYRRLCHKLQLEPPRWDPTQPRRRASAYKVANQKIKLSGFNFQHPNLNEVFCD